MKAIRRGIARTNCASDDFPEVVQTIDFRKLKRWFHSLREIFLKNF